MQNPIQKFRQSSIVFEKLGILSRKLKTLTKSNCRRVKYFLRKFCTLSFGLDLELFANIQNNLVSTQSLRLFSLITQDLSKIKRYPEHAFVGTVK